MGADYLTMPKKVGKCQNVSSEKHLPCVRVTDAQLAKVRLKMNGAFKGQEVRLFQLKVKKQVQRQTLPTNKLLELHIC